ncbi:hypothetical protein ScPMuIL_006652 [Solemya velum]
MFGFGHIIPEMGRNFNQTYRCYSVSMLADREDVERGGKIIMPPSALDQLTRLHIQYPMLFKLCNKRTKRETHCGVLEFVADEGRIYIPYWMMLNLLLNEGDLVQIENVSLSIATFAKFQPQAPDFLDITNPKAVLENALRNFACLTAGDVLAIKYNEKVYEMCVLEVKPGKAVSIIECDMNVEFAAPVGYQEPKFQRKVEEDITETDVSHLVIMPDGNAFSGSGNRLDGKKKGVDVKNSSAALIPVRRGIPNYNFKKGTLTFIRSQRPVVNGTTEDKSEKTFEAFSGEGQSLRKKGRK